VKTNSKFKIRNPKQYQIFNDTSSKYFENCEFEVYFEFSPPRKLTDSNYEFYQTNGAYYPFGEMITGTGDVHGFTGKELDNEMGLNYFCLRYYDPQIGRFMTLDPFGGYVELPQTQMRYGYCINNPLKYIDPLGLSGGDNSQMLWQMNLGGDNISYWLLGGDYYPVIDPALLPEPPGIEPCELLSGAAAYENTLAQAYANASFRLLYDLIRFPSPGRKILYASSSAHQSTIIGSTSAGDGPPSSWGAPTQYTKAIEFQRIISSYTSWWNVNYPQNYTTAIPGIRAFQREAWSCVDWCDALEKMLKNLDLRFYTIQRLQSPSWYAPVPLFHNWIVLTSGSGFIWLDPWWYGSYFGVELGGD